MPNTMAKMFIMQKTNERKKRYNGEEKKNLLTGCNMRQPL
jgi:hypothetical protein